MAFNKIWFITLFPEIIRSYFQHGVISRASNYLEIVNPADFSEKGRKGVDSAPYGGGPGMVMRADVLAATLDKTVLKGSPGVKREGLHVVYTSPVGPKWDSVHAKKLSRNIITGSIKDLVFICGRYEGVDQRFIDLYVDSVFSVGDFVLTGGELPCLSIADSFLRFVPGTLGNEVSAADDSFENGLLDSPKWTRPSIFKGRSVPEVLLSGNHSKIDQFNDSMRKPISST